MSLPRRSPPPFVVAANRFAFELRAELGEQPGNLIFSPASVAVALAMTWHGAAGATRDEISNVLGFTRNAEELAREAGQLAAGLQSSGSGVTLAMANRLFGASGYAFEPDFLEEVARAFGAPFAPVDFAGDPDGARTQINRWVDEVTKGTIRDLVGPGAVTTDTRLALVNAVYFLGDWKEPFDPKWTKPMPFRVGGGPPLPVPTMTQIGTFRTARVPGASGSGDDGVEIVELAYAGGSAAMVIVMPNAPDGLSALPPA